MEAKRQLLCKKEQHTEQDIAVAAPVPEGSADVPWWVHLGELRRRIIWCAAAFLAAFAALGLTCAETLTEMVLFPVRAQGVEFIYLGPADILYVQIKIVFLAALLLAAPIILWQIWQFVRPALYETEKRLVLVWGLASTVLFVAGAAFGYMAVFTAALSFFVYVGRDVALPLMAVDRYVNFLIGFILPFGLIFELPLVTAVLARLGIVSAGALKKGRRYAILTSFIIGAFLTPPDVVSQMMMALPTIALYEAGIITASLCGTKKYAACDGGAKS